MATHPAFRTNSLLLLLLLCAPAPLTAAGSEEAAHWLERMNHAVNRLAFHGTFVYLSGEILEALELRHRIVNGRLQESLYSLNGSRRRIERNGDRLVITTWEKGVPKRYTSPSHGRLSPLKPLEFEFLRNYYQLKMGTPTRVAGRQGVVVVLAPRDDLRYGYWLVLDKATALPLELAVFNHQGRVVSRVMFTQVETDQETADNPTQPQAAHASSKSPSNAPAVSPEKEKKAVSRWRFKTLPTGFQVVGRQYNPASGQNHFILSDGLATVSVYVEPLAKGDKPFDGDTRLGSVNAFGRHLGRRQLTVVGEVPLKTLKLIADAMEQEP